LTSGATGGDRPRIGLSVCTWRIGRPQWGQGGVAGDLAGAVSWATASTKDL